MFSRTICGLPTAYLDSQQSGVLLSKLTYNIEQVAGAATGAAISLVSDTLTILGLLAYLFYLNWRLATFCIFAVPPDRLAHANRQSQFPPLQQAHPELDGRHHPGREGGHRRARV